MSSALYEGTVGHRRVAPAHAFTNRLALPFLDLAELDEVAARSRLWSQERPNAVSFRRTDYLGDPAVPLDRAVRDLVAERTARRPSGPIRLLAHVRTWGWLFNPLAVYYCMDATGTAVEAIVLEVTNTPWGERHAYVVAGPGEHRFPKALHVSPFFGMDQEYRLRVGEPGPELRLELALLEGETVVFEAALRLRRRPLAVGRLLWRHPLQTVRVSTAIRWQALRLWTKRATFHRHPARTATEGPRCPVPRR